MKQVLIAALVFGCALSPSLSYAASYTLEFNGGSIFDGRSLNAGFTTADNGTNSSITSVSGFLNEVYPNFDPDTGSILPGSFVIPHSITGLSGLVSSISAGFSISLGFVADSVTYQLTLDAGDGLLTRADGAQYAGFGSYALNEISAVPLPSSAPMFGAALLGLAGLGYAAKRKKATAQA